MSILIKGMEMPKHGEGVCLIVTNFENCGSPVAMLVDRESILPKDFYDAIEIPTPHGRLIDADELFCKIDGIKGWDYGDESDMAISAAEALSAIDDSPTVIEAEVSE